jgi:hypothetical protein
MEIGQAIAAMSFGGGTMRYGLVLLAALAAAFAASDGNCTDHSEGGVSMFTDFATGKLQLAAHHGSGLLKRSR